MKDVRKHWATLPAATKARLSSGVPMAKEEVAADIHVRRRAMRSRARRGRARGGRTRTSSTRRNRARSRSARRS
eukprot:6328288-Lingulodinium_polyedra.AAC.1